MRAAVEDATAADGTRAVVLDCETMPYVDVTAARMLNRLAAALHRRGVRLVLAGEIRQVRDVVASVGEHDQVPGYHRTVAEAVRAAQAGLTGPPAGEG